MEPCPDITGDFKFAHKCWLALNALLGSDWNSQLYKMDHRGYLTSRPNDLSLLPMRK